MKHQNERYKPSSATGWEIKTLPTALSISPSLPSPSPTVPSDTGFCSWIKKLLGDLHSWDLLHKDQPGCPFCLLVLFNA